jgi:hypothetical protein
VIGRRPGFEIAGADYRVCDVADYAPLREMVRGCDTIVHLAAIPNPRAAPGPEVFRANVAGAYNVFEAAADEGIRRMVQASSINAFGCFWGNRDIAPDYLPIDEDHPTFTTDPYSFSKTVVEEIGAYYYRRAGLSSIALRLPGVWPRARLTSPELTERRRTMRAAIDEFAAQPESARAARLAELRRTTVEFRARGSMEYPPIEGGLRAPGLSDDPLWPAYAFDRFNFWTYVDERDSAQSIEKALVAEYEGSHALFINDRYNYLDYPARDLARLFFPEVTNFTTALEDAEALVSIAKACAMIGFDPEHSVHRSPAA